jgi:hypothetical protein
MGHQLPPDPWKSRTTSTSPRLCAFVHSRSTRHGGVVHLSAALWGGHHERSVPLSLDQAHDLAHELLAHVADLQRQQRPPARSGATPRPPASRPTTPRSDGPAPAGPAAPRVLDRVTGGRRIGYPRARRVRPVPAVESPR